MMRSLSELFSTRCLADNVSSSISARRGYRGRASYSALRTSHLVPPLALAFLGCGRDQPVPTPPEYVGAAVCATCHESEAALWTGSDHDLAMQEATDATVLGDFDDATFDYNGVTSRFFRRADGFWVETDGADGQVSEFRIAYTFGHYPLQQYLIAQPAGRYQALGIAWDSRPDSAGGQSWFHLYPDEKIDHTDPLHWTGREQNWNYQCAECHSTNLAKNYDFATDSYQTTWSEIDVACEACHGAGSAHVGWAQGLDRIEYESSDDPYADNRPLRPDPTRVLTSASADAPPTGPTVQNAQLDVCSRCHSRRGAIVEGYDVDAPLLNTHRPALLTDPLYEPDGQIREEVYVYGSFLQSKMFEKGVVCTDCHDPHSARLKVDGNALCSSCHAPAVYDSEAHTFHASGTPGSNCVDCHMPARTYMVVDPRRDHSFRIPRPDLTATIGSPNACNGCHTNRSPAWAADKIEVLYGSDPNAKPHYGSLLHAGRTGVEGSQERLASLASDQSESGIVRATAVSMLGQFDQPADEAWVAAAASDRDPLVRMSAATASESMDARRRLDVIGPLLTDGFRAVRVEAARVLAPVAVELIPTNLRSSLDLAITEYEEAQWVNADRPESHVNLGLLYTARARFDEAVASYRNALRLEPRFVSASMNLADLYRGAGREDSTAAVLERALGHDSTDAALNHAYGLHLVREKRLPEALPHLEIAARNPADTRFNYVYAVALQSAGEIDEALVVAKKALAENPNDRRLKELVSSMNEDR